MKSLLHISILTAISFSSSGQFLPNSSQPYQFASIYNPAFTGVEPYADLKLGYRYQWTGFEDQSPKFANVLFNMRIKQPIDPELHGLRTSRSEKTNSIPRLKSCILGLGGNFFNERVGAVDRTGGGISFSFHYPIVGNVRIGAGLSAMVENTRIMLDKVYLGQDADPDPFYEQLVTNGVNDTNLNVRGGLLIYSPKAYLGLSYFPIEYTSIQSSEMNITESRYRASFQTGVSFPLGRSVNILPGVLGILEMNNTFLFDYNLKMLLRERAWIGVTYRSTQSGIGVLGFKLNELLVASYSYEISTNAMRQFSDGSHELVLSFKLSKNFSRKVLQVW
jgi:type IX secretion system PorP/SprF family membrane protein